MQQLLEVQDAAPWRAHAGGRRRSGERPAALAGRHRTSTTAYDELVLWFEHDLFDQLNLIQVLDWIHRHVPAGKPVSLVSIGAFPGHPDFKGLGELAPDDMASLLATRQAGERGPVPSGRPGVARVP